MRAFEDFEEEWRKKSVEHNVPLLNQGTRKRKWEECEDSLIVAKRRKLNEGAAVLQKLREENETKFHHLEARLEQERLTVRADCHGDMSQRRVSLNPSLSPLVNSTALYSGANYTSESYAPVCSSTLQTPVSTVGGYSPISPVYSGSLTDFVLPSSGLYLCDEQLNCLKNIGNDRVIAPSPPITPTYPLMEELRALNELVNSMQADLSQSSLLVGYIQDYLKTKK